MMILLLASRFLVAFMYNVSRTYQRNQIIHFIDCLAMFSGPAVP